MAHTVFARDLKFFRQFGLEALTGETDAYCLRLLFDVNAAGRQLLADFFGMPDISLSASWNSTVDGQPAVGAVLLPRTGLLPELAKFIMYHVQKHRHLLVEEGQMIGFDDEDLEQYDYLKAAVANGTAFHNPASAQAVNGRNVHTFSGRIG